MTYLKKGTAMLAVATLVIAVVTANVLAAPAPTPPGSSFEQRLAQRKTEQDQTMTVPDRERLTGTCGNGQSKIRILQASGLASSERYTKSYERTDARLWAIIGQLKLADKDTFKLEKFRLEYVGKTAAFKTTAADYRQTLDDILLINCKADVVGFRTLVLTARFYYAQLRTQAADIRTYVVDTIKPELASHATDLQPKTPSEGN